MSNKTIGKKTILVIDDEKEIRELLSKFFSEAGYQVLTAENGLRLISSIETEKVDLILLDIMMQWISGIDLCRSLRKNPDYTGTKIIFMTGKSSTIDKEEGFKVGCDDYFIKPFDMKKLLVRVQELIGK
ncbi:response regulator transcription factor [Spirochaetota bacterium]